MSAPEAVLSRSSPVARLRPTSRLRTRPAWWAEVLLIVVSYMLYSAVRNGVPAKASVALARAHALDQFERSLGIAVEQSVNLAVAGVGWLVHFCNYFYALAHFVVTIGVLLWLYRSHPDHYRPLRTALYVTNLVALAGFWAYPLAPPRMLSGFVDTVIAFGTWGSWNSDAIASASNEYAAMPSMHIGWALWCGVCLWRLARRRRWQLAGLLYPLATLFVIVATANHFVLDAVGGAAVLAVGFTAQRLISGSPAFVRRAASSAS